MRTEVDFLLRRRREFVAIKVKASKRFERSMTQELSAIADLPGVACQFDLYQTFLSLTLTGQMRIVIVCT